jgi:hypothetical protein
MNSTEAAQQETDLIAERTRLRAEVREIEKKLDGVIRQLGAVEDRLEGCRNVLAYERDRLERSRR